MTRNLKTLKMSDKGKNVEQGEYLYTISGRLSWLNNLGKLC